MPWYWLLFFGGIPALLLIAFVVSLTSDIWSRTRGKGKPPNRPYDRWGYPLVSEERAWPVIAVVVVGALVAALLGNLIR